MLSGCALKAPPDAAAIKEQSMATVQTPAQWTAPGAGAGAACRQLARHVRRRSAGRRGRRSHRPQRRSARRRDARRAGAALRQTGGREAVPVGRSARSRRRQAVRRRLGPAGRRPLRDLGARPLGPRALRPGGERRASRVGAGGFRVRAAVDCGPRGQELVPRHRGGVADPGGTRDHSCERGAGTAGRRPNANRRRRSMRRSSSRAPASARYRDAAAVSSNWDASRRFVRWSSCSAAIPRQPP